MTAFYHKFVVSFILKWADQSLSQIQQLRTFLVSHGVQTSPKVVFSRGCHQVIVARRDALLEATRRMLPHSFKKKGELQTILDYYNDAITGTDVWKRFAETVRHGDRERSNRWFLRAHHIPYTRSEGDEAAELLRTGKSAKSRRILSSGQIERIKIDHCDFGVPLVKLAKLHKVSKSTIWNAIRREE
ncbi:MAG: hypothetical protein HYY68_00375 [Thaumarchaeota archaeon]|nr:hypothetical protein [Nitrososphaerota archaeon]